MKTAESSVSEAIAIVGVACRLPGAPDVDALWQALVSERDCVTEFPGGRTADLDAYYAQPGVANFAPTRRGGFLPDTEMFDAEFFSISPREAEWTDPQQRMLLEVGWEAFEDAGLTRAQLAGSKTGVFIGVWASDYEMHCEMNGEVMDFFHLAGGPLYGASGRLAFQFDLRGPDVSVNAACASSLVSVHLAVRSLRSGESSVALAGGVNLIFRHEMTQALGAANVLSRDGRCRFGDASGQGFVRSEGVALLVLKRLSDAERDGDRILGLIRGTAVTNNGQESGSMSTPSEVGQRQAMLDALADGQVDAATVSYVEAHGTGTRAGDPVELAAIGSVFGRAGGRAKGLVLPVGSVKSNIGHTESTAGVAGILKAMLAIRHGFLPATIHVEELNPLVDWAHNGLALQLDGAEWPRELAGSGPRRASVNGLGLTGTNAHVVLEEAPARQQTGLAEAKEIYLLPISAATEGALRLRAGSMAARVLECGEAGLADLCYTAAVRRTHLAHRLAVVGGSAEELGERLQAFADGRDAAGLVAATGTVRKVAFVFPGQGSQWVGMGRELLRTEPVFLAAIEACDRAIAAETGWSVMEQLQSPALAERLTRIDVIQPTLFAMEVALAELWRSRGVVPQAVVGHSMGEVAAARVAGILSLEDAAKIICRRSKLLIRVAGQGAMVVVDLPRAEAEQAIAGLEDRVSIAVSNSPRSTVLAGDPKALDGLVERLEAAEVFCRWVRVDVASHSPQMDPLKGDLSAALSDLEPQTGDVPLYSTVRSALLTGPELDTGYWVSNLRETVQFAAAIEALMAQGFDTFVEMSPHPILIPFVEQTAQHVGGAVLAVGSLRREEAEAATLLLGLGRVFAQGGEVGWGSLYQAGMVVSLPAYPWQRERYWVEEGVSRKGSGMQAGHALVGEPLRVATGELVWTARLTAEAHPWLKDHAVEGSVLLPASAFAEIAQEVGEVVAEGRGGEAGQAGLAVFAIERLRLDQAITMGDEGAMHVQLVATPHADGSYGLEFFSRDGEALEWSRAAAGRLVTATALTVEEVSLAEWEDAELSGEAVSGQSHSEGFARRGYEFGPSFCQIDWLALEDRQGLAAIRVPEGLQGTNYAVHPTTLDGALQLLGGMLLREAGEGETLLPVDFERVEFTAVRDRSEVFYARATRSAGAALRGDVALYDALGRLRARVTGLEFKPLAGAAGDESKLDECLFSPEWERLDEVAAAQTAGEWLLIRDAGGVADGLALALKERGAEVAVAGLEQVLAGQVPVVEGLVGVVLATALDVNSLEQLQAVLLGAAGLVRLLTETGESGAAETGVSPRLWWLTRDAQTLAGERVASPLAAGVWGFAASVRNEHPELRASCMDFAELDMATVADELLADGEEDRVLLRTVEGRAERYGARLQRFAANAEAGTIELAEFEARVVESKAGSAGGFALAQWEPGSLDSFELRSQTRAVVGAGEVEIAVEASALNFRDVLRATGNAFLASSGFLGGECSGTVVRVGAGVTELRPGDRVVAISASFEEMTLFSSRVVLPETLVVRIPETMSFAEAAGLPCVFLTVYCALVRQAHLERGETILIHAAAGGVGLAAIQVAHWLGAEVYATVGSEEKRAYVASLGVKHIMNSRTLDFQREIQEKTNGRGVDVVLNSLAGAAITSGLESLAPYGRFIEIGKRDIFEDSKVGLRPFKENRSFLALDLAQYVEDRRETVGVMLREVMELFERGVFKPLPVTLLPVSQAGDAFRMMATGRHIGKITLDMRDPSAVVRVGTNGISREASYLITGGLGGLGLVAAEALAARGARHLVLLSRRAAGAETLAALDRLAGLGVRVAVRAVDIGSADEVDALFKEIRTTMPPLRGVIHAAGVLDDAVVGHLTAEKFSNVMAGKVGGALAMDGHFHAGELDFVVYYASAAGILGNPGQANYAAANAVLDGLAGQQRARGIPATSIDWGSWAEVGLAAQQENRGARLATQGVRPLSPTEGAGLLLRILEDSPAQVAAMGFDADAWCASNPGAAETSYLAGLRTGTGMQLASAGFAEQCRTMPVEMLHEALIPWLQEQVAGVLRCGAERVLPDKPLRSLGLDSLTALELRNRLERGLHLKLSATLAWNYPTLVALAGHLQTKITAAGDAGHGKALPTTSLGAANQTKAVAVKVAEKPAKEVHSAPVVVDSSAGGLSAAELLEAELLSVESLLNS